MSADNLFRRGVKIWSAVLNNLSMGADDGMDVLYLTNIFFTISNLCNDSFVRCLSAKKLKA